MPKKTKNDKRKEKIRVAENQRGLSYSATWIFMPKHPNMPMETAIAKADAPNVI